MGGMHHKDTHLECSSSRGGNANSPEEEGNVNRSLSRPTQSVSMKRL